MVSVIWKEFRKFRVQLEITYEATYSEVMVVK